MAREIKFRAWFKREIEIGKPLRFDMVIDEDEGEMVFQMVSDKEIRYPPIVIFGDPDEWILEQFTGMKDKNGIEIYEGDILKTSYAYVREVYWDEEMAGFFTRNSDPDDPFYGFPFLLAHGTIEIIGNLHEHPHLLKQ